ncbi:MAG: TetR/AcrR family transcriptional regulator, partial [Solirubrobacteraceae bacterium]|nr:TetR/AcrR family transcriptional regulator [Solirubrobacteraceae bacterium]
PPDEKLPAERRQALIAAASAEFAEKGYVAAGIADIDERLDVGRGTFYRYFSSKREILDHVVDDAIARLVASIMLDSTLGDVNSAEEFFGKMGELVDRVFATVDAEPGLVRLLLFETTSVDEEMTLRLLGGIDLVTAAVAGSLEDGIRKGFLRDDLETSAVAGDILYMLVPSLLRALRGLLDDDIRGQYRDGVVDLIARGIAPDA